LILARSEEFGHDLEFFHFPGDSLPCVKPPLKAGQLPCDGLGVFASPEALAGSYLR
jgi:hypothetical protein